MEMHTARSLFQVHGVILPPAYPRGPGLLSLFWVGLRAAIAAMIRMNREARDIEALRSMDDRLLADMGIRRSQIEGAVRDGLPGRRWFDGA